MKNKIFFKNILVFCFMFILIILIINLFRYQNNIKKDFNVIEYKKEILNYSFDQNEIESYRNFIDINKNHQKNRSMDNFWKEYIKSEEYHKNNIKGKISNSSSLGNNFLSVFFIPSFTVAIFLIFILFAYLF